MEGEDIDRITPPLIFEIMFHWVGQGAEYIFKKYPSMVAMMANGPIVTSDAERASPPEGPKHSKRAKLTEKHVKNMFMLQWNSIIFVSFFFTFLAPVFPLPY